MRVSFLLFPTLLLSLSACRSSDKDGVEDLTDSGDTDDHATSYTNTPPVVDEIVLTPDPVGTNDVLVANVAVSDVDTNTIALDYVWFVDSLVIDDVGAELSGELYFDKGDAITVSVTPHDGLEFGASLSAGPLTVSNSLPTAPEISITDDGDLLGVMDTPSEDADGDAISYTFAWTLEEKAYEGATSTTETGDTVPFADTSGAQTWTLTVTPFDGEDEGEAGTASLVLEARSCAFQFDDDSAVLWVDSADFGIGQQDFTLEFWISPGDELGDWGTIFRTSEGSSQAMRVTVSTDDSSVMELDTVLSQSSGYCEEPNDGADASIPRDGAWHHIAIVRSGAVLYTYMDGELFTTGDMTWSGCSCGTSATPCIAESGPGLFGQTAPTGVAIGPMRFALGVAYTESFEPDQDWAIDANSIAQWNTEQCFDGVNLPDSAGGNNTGSSSSGITAVEGP
jgi:hypothetical protein